jgi:uncharacterized protein YndB with AHSA1/START domain
VNDPGRADAIRIERTIHAPRQAVFDAWLSADVLRRWWPAGADWETPVAEVEPRVGGRLRLVMRSPEGEEFANRGVYLEVVKNERLVFTDAYTSAWAPSDKAFFTCVLSFEALPGGRTRYVARACHWSDADCDAHEKMGFHEGWAQCTEQLAALVARL